MRKQPVSYTKSPSSSSTGYATSTKMPREIERKFLVKGPVVLPKTSSKILQGYLPDNAEIALDGNILVITPMPGSPTAPRVRLEAKKYLSEIKHGVINAVGPRVLRIRNEEGCQPIFCMKVDLKGAMERVEVELETPELDAMYLVQTCREKVLRKSRFRLTHSGKLWEVDAFNDPFNGLLTAEIELKHARELFEVPPWVGEEVTFRREFSNRALAEAQRIPEFALQMSSHR